MTSNLPPTKLPRLLRMAKNPKRALSRPLRATQRGLIKGSLLRMGVPRQLSGRAPRLLGKFTKGIGKTAPEEEITSTTLESLTGDGSEADSNNLGLPTLVERSRLLESDIQHQKGDVGRVLFRANTLAIVTRGSLLSRILNKLKKILLAPFAIIAALLAMGNGAKPGLLKKPVLVVDSAGRVTLFKDGRIRTPYLGIDIRETKLDEPQPLLMRNRHVLTGRGLRVKPDVLVASRAYRAGIKSGDILLTFQKQLVGGDSLPAAKDVSTEPQITVLREGLTTEIILGPPESGDRWPGFQVEPAADFRPVQVTVDRELTAESGIEVTGVHADGPAEHGGVQRGDILLAAEQILLDTQDALRLAMGPRMIESKTELRLWRPRTIETVSLTPARNGKSIETYLGMSYRMFTFASELHAMINKRWLTFKLGIVVMRTQPGGVAASEDLFHPDVILAIDGKPIESENKAKELLASAAERGREVTLLIRGGALVEVNVTPVERTQELVATLRSNGSAGVSSRTWT